MRAADELCMSGNSEERILDMLQSLHFSRLEREIKNQDTNTDTFSPHVSRLRPSVCRMPLRSMARVSSEALGSM